MVTVWNLRKDGGQWLGAARNYLQSYVRFGDRLTWGSNEPTGLTVAQVEEMAANIAATAINEYISNTKVLVLTKCEIQSGLNRQRAAEGLILQLPADHDGRNTWLLNYGIGKEAQLLREGHNPYPIKWDGECEAAHSHNWHKDNPQLETKENGS